MSDLRLKISKIKKHQIWDYFLSFFRKIWSEFMFFDFFHRKDIKIIKNHPKIQENHQKSKSKKSSSDQILSDLVRFYQIWSYFIIFYHLPEHLNLQFCSHAQHALILIDAQPDIIAHIGFGLDGPREKDQNKCDPQRPQRHFFSHDQHVHMCLASG